MSYFEKLKELEGEEIATVRKLTDEECKKLFFNRVGKDDLPVVIELESGKGLISYTDAGLNGVGWLEVTEKDDHRYKL